MSAAVRQWAAGAGEAMIVVRHGLVEVGAEAESRPIRVRKRRQTDPDAAGPRTALAEPVDQAATDPRLGVSRHPLAYGPGLDGPGGPRRTVIDQGLEGIDPVPRAEGIDVDRPPGPKSTDGRELIHRDRATVEQDEPAAAERERMRLLDRLECDPFLGQDELQAGRSFPQEQADTQATSGE